MATVPAEAVVALAPPRANPHLAAQEAAERTLLAAWQSGRMAHSWLLGGPRGIGKATLAYRFARFALAGGGAGGLFGDAPVSLALDLAHPVFRRVASGGHGDLLVVERHPNPKTGKLRDEIVVEDVRGVGDFLHLTPAEGGWRVVIVDAADEMNVNAANALLKVLEEPPRQALLLLVSHAPGRLLPTIRSRCRTLMLPPLADTAMQTLIERYRPELAAADRAALVGLAAGSIGRALELAEWGGVELHREMLALLGSLPELDIPAVYDFADRLGRSGEDAAANLRTAFDLLSDCVARVIRCAATRQPAGELAAGEAQLIARMAARGLDPWLPVWERLNRLPAAAEGLNLDRRLVLLDAFLAVAKGAGA